MFSNLKVIVWIIVISILTKIIVIMIFFHNRAALISPNIKLFLSGYLRALMTQYLLHHIQLRAMWELLYSASQLLQVHHQMLSFSKHLLLPPLLGHLQYLENGGIRTSYKKIYIHDILLKVDKGTIPHHWVQSHGECFLARERQLNSAPDPRAQRYGRPRGRSVCCRLPVKHNVEVVLLRL